MKIASYLHIYMQIGMYSDIKSALSAKWNS